VQGPHAYIIRGVFTDVPDPSSDVTLDLGSPDVANGINHPQNTDGNTTATSMGGRNCRMNVNPAVDRYFYFSVNDAFAFQASRADVYILVEYFDSGTNPITLEYDSTGSAYNVGGTITLTGTNTWKCETFHLADAFFGNRQNVGADFRLGDVSNSFYLDTVRVSVHPVIAPVVGEVAPVQITYPGTAYSQQLMLTQGHPAPEWMLLEGPAGAAVNASGLISGWTPGGFGDYAFTVQAANCEGVSARSWVVRVTSRMDYDLDLDVDQADYGFLQRCMSGTGIGYETGCAPADLEPDGVVDGADFSQFLPCMVGADRLPGC
jgi:hypothetical protein